MTIRDILNKVIWDPHENVSNYELVFIHRGAHRDTKVVSGTLLTEVEQSGFTYKNGKEGEVFIPFHRVLEIRNVMTGQVSWKKRILKGSKKRL